QIRRLRDVKRTGGDEEDVIGLHHPVLGVDRRSFDDGQDVALHAFAADVGTVAPFAAGDLVDLVDEDDARLLDALDGGAGHAVHVDQLLLFLLLEVLERLGHLQLPPFGLALKEAREHVLEVDIYLFDRRAGDDLERGKRFLPHVDFDDARVEAAGPQLLAETLARLLLLIADRRRILVRRERPRRRQQDVKEAIFGILTRLRTN